MAARAIFVRDCRGMLSRWSLGAFPAGSRATHTTSQSLRRRSIPGLLKLPQYWVVRSRRRNSKVSMDPTD
eukprot:273969-Rhodomonas_salina.1